MLKAFSFYLFIYLFVYLSIYLFVLCRCEISWFAQLLLPKGKKTPLLHFSSQTVICYEFSTLHVEIINCVGFTWQDFGSEGSCTSSFSEKTSRAVTHIRQSQFELTSRGSCCWQKMRQSVTLEASL